MKEEFERTALMFGEDGVERLKSARVALFGLGGVGGHCAEALARAGIGNLTLIDGDVISLSNLNRQIIALHSDAGEYKGDAFRKRIADINPDCNVTVINEFFTEESDFDFSGFDYVIDAIDSVKDKIELICRAKGAGVPVISAMGAGNKVDPSRFEVADISKTSVCPLAKAVRVKLRQRGIEHLKVVYSKEEPFHSGSVVGSNSFTPGVMGMIMAGEVIKEVIRGTV